MRLFEKHKVYTRVEVAARYEIGLSNYNQVIRIESLTMSRIAKTQILPAVLKYSKDLSDEVLQKRMVSKDIDTSSEEAIIKQLSSYIKDLYHGYTALDEAIAHRDELTSNQEIANYNRDVILPAMAVLREGADALERICAKSYWPFPTYGDLLYSF